jgi:ornithine cyclodeaminase/alanine dehydrogenase-like protein (mu-crystallin family)
MSAGTSGGTRLLGIDDVSALLSLEETIELQRAAFGAQARGLTRAAPNSWLRLPPERGGWIKLLSGYDGGSRSLGVKVLARFPQRASGENLGSLLLLFDDESGAPLAVMDAVYVTAVRTVAGAALASEALARPDSRRLGLVGTGVLAWHSLRAHRLLLPDLESVMVYSRSPERREALAARAREELGLEATSVDTAAAAAAGADILITATNSPEPVLGPEALEPGMHVNAIGIRTELDPGALAKARVFGDGREEALRDGKFSVALAAGAVAEEDLGPELGEVLEGLAAGRADAGEITLFDSSGVAIQDLVCARHVWERAEESGAGAVFDFAGASVLG